MRLFWCHRPILLMNLFSNSCCAMPMKVVNYSALIHSQTALMAGKMYVLKSLEKNAYVLPKMSMSWYIIYLLRFLKCSTWIDTTLTRNIDQCLIELTHIVPDGIAVIFTQIHVSCDNRTEHTCQSAKCSGILFLARLCCHKLIESLHILKIVEHKIANLIAKVIDPVQIRASLVKQQSEILI